jgi:pimeloyl-ACP methyl ester carboxylesterase
MPTLKRGEVSIHYEEFGSGYPIMSFAPGSWQSSIDLWHRAPWDPTVELATGYRVIAVDQRNAGGSWAPITAADGWHSYEADHVALLDELGIEQAHLMGACIGCSFVLRLLQAQPHRFSAAVLQQPIGTTTLRTENTGFYRWRDQLTGHPEATDLVFQSLEKNLYSTGFVFSVSKDFIRSCDTPLLVLAGNDENHPFAVAQEIAALAPSAEFIPEWREGPARESAFRRVREFLAANTPAAARRT